MSGAGAPRSEPGCTADERVFRELIERAFCQGELDAVDRSMAPDLIDHENGSSLRGGSGRDGFKWVIRSLRTAFPDLVVSVEDFAAVGDRTWARVRYRGTNTGPFIDAPPTGRTVEWDGVSICRFAGGRIVEHWGVVDRLGGLQQLGLARMAGTHAG